MTKTVTLADYGIGNLLSVRRALEHVGAAVMLAQTPEQIQKADYLIVPGVGAFQHCMEILGARGLKDALITHAHSGKPYLGICVGMQMLLEESEEFGIYPGLGLFKGRVKHLPKGEAVHQKIPCIGWRTLETTQSHPVFADIKSGEDKVYLVHSFAAETEDAALVSATYCYGSHKIVAAVARENIIGTQFHPEKSGQVGLRLLQRFLEM